MFGVNRFSDGRNGIDHHENLVVRLFPAGLGLEARSSGFYPRLLLRGYGAALGGYLHLRLGSGLRGRLWVRGSLALGAFWGNRLSFNRRSFRFLSRFGVGIVDIRMPELQPSDYAFSCCHPSIGSC